MRKENNFYLDNIVNKPWHVLIAIFSQRDKWPAKWKCIYFIGLRFIMYIQPYTAQHCGNQFLNPRKLEWKMRSHLPLPHDGLGPGVPVPQEHRAVLAAADDVAVGGVVALRAG